MALQTKLTVIPAIATIDLVKLSPELDGSNGANRAIGNRPQITVNTDADAIKIWLARYFDTKTVGAHLKLTRCAR